MSRELKFSDEENHGKRRSSFEQPDRRRNAVRLGSMARAQASIWADSWKDCRSRSGMFTTNPRWQFVSGQGRRLGGILPEVCRRYQFVCQPAYPAVRRVRSELL